jgi:hypothetical protein
MNNVMQRRLVAELRPKLPSNKLKKRHVLQRHPLHKPRQILELQNSSVSKNWLRLLNVREWSMNRL